MSSKKRCIECLANKKKVYFDIDKARAEAKKLAVENEKTFAIYKEGKAVSYTDADTAIAKGYPILEFLSQHL